MTYDDFLALFERLSATGGSAGGRRTPARVVHAAGLVRDGRVIELAQRWETTGGAHDPKPAQHYLSKVAETVGGAPEPTLYCDYVGVDYHDKRVTHLDALNHVAFRGRLHGGVPAAPAVTGHGLTAHDVTEIGPIVTRGVLLDLARLDGVPGAAPGRVWTAADLDRADHAGAGPGDAVLIRSGNPVHRAASGGADLNAGLHPDCATWLAERGVSLLGSDDTSDARPPVVEGVSLPIHALVLVALGVPMLDGLDLEALADACAAAGRWEFLLTVAPLTIPHATGSPVTPLAVL